MIYSIKLYTDGMWLLFLALIAPFTPTIDLYVSGLFYTPESGFFNNTFFSIMFDYGELFGLASGASALLLFGASFLIPKWKKLRLGALAMLLTLVIGAGFLTNVVFKGCWGRPRPKQIIEFGGQHPYRPFWQPKFQTKSDPQKSFPSGHVAMGFYFLSLCLIGKRYQKPLLFYTGLCLTCILGGGLMVTRIVQGGHFFSDVIVSPVLMWYVACGIDLLVFRFSTKITSEGYEKPTPGSNSAGISPKSDGPLEV